jgi:Major Facilitator Superfamily
VRGRLPGRARTLAADRSFRIFLSATLVTGLGSYAGAIALALRTFDATRSTTWASLLFVAELLPGVALGAAGGRLLDRLPPRRALAAAEAAGGVLWLLLALVGRPPVVLVLALAAGTAAAGVRIVSAAALPRLAGDALEAANGAVVSAENTTMLAGTALGGVLAGALGADAVLALNGVSFLVAAALLARCAGLSGPAVPDDEDVAPRQRGWLVGDPGLRLLVLTVPPAFAGMGVACAAEVPLLRSVLDAPAGLVGAVVALGSLGIVLGSLATATLAPRAHAYGLALAAMGAGWAAFGVAPTAAFAAGAALAAGVGNGVALVGLRAALQRAAPAASRASTIGRVYALSTGSAVAGAALTGPLASALGLRGALLAAGAAIALGGAVGLVRAGQLPAAAAVDGPTRYAEP